MNMEANRSCFTVRKIAILLSKLVWVGSWLFHIRHTILHLTSEQNFYQTIVQ